METKKSTIMKTISFYREKNGLKEPLTQRLWLRLQAPSLKELQERSSLPRMIALKQSDEPDGLLRASIIGIEGATCEVRIEEGNTEFSTGQTLTINLEKPVIPLKGALAIEAKERSLVLVDGTLSRARELIGSTPRYQKRRFSSLQDPQQSTEVHYGRHVWLVDEQEVRLQSYRPMNAERQNMNNKKQEET